MTLRPDINVPDPEALIEQPGSVWRITLRRFMKRKLGIAGLIMVTFMVLVALLAPLIAPYSATEDFIGEPWGRAVGAALRQRPWV